MYNQYSARHWAALSKSTPIAVLGDDATIYNSQGRNEDRKDAIIGTKVKDYNDTTSMTTIYPNLSLYQRWLVPAFVKYMETQRLTLKKRFRNKVSATMVSFN